MSMAGSYSGLSADYVETVAKHYHQLLERARTFRGRTPYVDLAVIWAASELKLDPTPIEAEALADRLLAEAGTKRTLNFFLGPRPEGGRT